MGMICSVWVQLIRGAVLPHLRDPPASIGLYLLCLGALGKGNLLQSEAPHSAVYATSKRQAVKTSSVCYSSEMSSVAM